MNAEQFARKAHAGQTYAGRDYADGHLAGVVARAVSQTQRLLGFEIERLMAAAWLHDVVEDTPTTLADLARFPSPVVHAVGLLTRRDDETYREYISRLCDSGCRIALEVKRADLEFNIIQSGCEESAEFDDLARKRWLPALGQVLRALGHFRCASVGENERNAE